MKRHLLLAALFAAPLYLRQRDVEKRQREWQQRCLAALVGDYTRLADEVTSVLGNWREADQQWSEKLVKEIKRAARGEFH